MPMWLLHQSKDMNSDSDWEDVESEENNIYPIINLDCEDWVDKFSVSIHRFLGAKPWDWAYHLWFNSKRLSKSVFKMIGRCPLKGCQRLSTVFLAIVGEAPYFSESWITLFKKRKRWDDGNKPEVEGEDRQEDGDYDEKGWWSWKGVEAEDEGRRQRGRDDEQGEVDEVEQQGGGDEDRTPESFEYPPWPALCISIDDNRAMSRADILSYQERNHLCCCMSWSCVQLLARICS